MGSHEVFKFMFTIQFRFQMFLRSSWLPYVTETSRNSSDLLSRGLRDKLKNDFDTKHSSWRSSHKIHTIVLIVTSFPCKFLETLLKGYYTMYTPSFKFMFWSLSQNYQRLFGQWNMYLNKLSKELKNSIEIWVGEVVFKLLMKIFFWLFWSII